MAGVVVLVLVLAVAGLGSAAAPQAGANPGVTTDPVPQTSVSPASAQPRPKSGTKTRPDLRKQHGYDAVPLPTAPASLGTAKQITTDDKLYDESVSKHLCPDGPPMNRHPYPSLSDSQLRAWLQKIADCDQAMWAGPVAKAGFQATKVRVRLIKSATIVTPCGTQYRGLVAAFYCSANQELYVDPALANPSQAHTYDWGQYWEIVSHEYGHSIQARTGILIAASMLESSARSTADANRWSRRIELQAQCFSGLAVSRVGGMSTARFKQQARFETTRTLTADHGTGEHQAAWFVQGHKYRQVLQCDTFKAPASEVS